MSWKLKPCEFPPTPEEIECRAPGDTWKIPLTHRFDNGETYEEAWRHFLSPEFRASGRDHVIVVRLPSGTDWVVDHVSSGSLQRGNPQGWTVTGAWPQISVTPSINEVDRYHGWVSGGEISDDLEGRTFA
jgi:hypothetical protein